MGSLRFLRAPLIALAAAACILVTFESCGRSTNARLIYLKHADAPDGKHVAFSASCRMGKYGKRLEAPVLAISRDDPTTWTQLCDWESYEITGYEWVDATTLKIRGKRRHDEGPSRFRLDSDKGVKLVWAIE